MFATRKNNDRNPIIAKTFEKNTINGSRETAKMAGIEDVHKANMKSAYNYAELSYCIRKKVGAVLVKDDSIIAIGYNGTPAGWDNCCEDADKV